MKTSRLINWLTLILSALAAGGCFRSHPLELDGDAGSWLSNDGAVADAPLVPPPVPDGGPRYGCFEDELLLIGHEARCADWIHFTAPDVSRCECPDGAPFCGPGAVVRVRVPPSPPRHRLFAFRPPDGPPRAGYLVMAESVTDDEPSCRCVRGHSAMHGYGLGGVNVSVTLGTGHPLGPERPILFGPPGTEFYLTVCPEGVRPEEP